MELEKLASIFEACRVLPLRPTDMLVFRSPQKLNIPEMAEIHRYLEEQTGHSRILILVDGADLAVLRPEEAPWTRRSSSASRRRSKRRTACSPPRRSTDRSRQALARRRCAPMADEIVRQGLSEHAALPRRCCR
jgi:hypothetical protein